MQHLESIEQMITYLTLWLNACAFFHVFVLTLINFPTPRKSLLALRDAVRVAQMALQYLVGIICIGPNGVNFGVLKTKLEDSEKFCCSEGALTNWETYRKPLGYEKDHWKYGFKLTNVPDKVKMLATDEGCKQLQRPSREEQIQQDIKSRPIEGSTRNDRKPDNGMNCQRVHDKACESLVGEYKRGCWLNNYGFKTWRGSPKRKRTDGTETDRSTGAEQMQNLDPQGFWPTGAEILKRLLHTAKTRQFGQLLALVIAFTPWVVDHPNGFGMKGGVAAQHACQCAQVLKPLANLDRGWAIDASYCKGDAKNCTASDPIMERYVSKTLLPSCRYSNVCVPFGGLILYFYPDPNA